jgi:hypothetical protein
MTNVTVVYRPSSISWRPTCIALTLGCICGNNQRPEGTIFSASCLPVSYPGQCSSEPGILRARRSTPWAIRSGEECEKLRRMVLLPPPLA